MNSRKILLLVAACLISLSLILASCGKSGTTTATFEQKRSDVIKFLQAFNSIRNDAVAAQIALPTSYNSRADLLAWNAAVTKLLAAIDVASSRLAKLQPSSLEPSTDALLQQARVNAQSQQKLLKALQDAVNAYPGEDPQKKAVQGAKILAAATALSTAGSSSTLLNRGIEQLMLQYNISDGEVDYRFRGR